MPMAPARAVSSKDITILNNYAYFLSEKDMKLKEAEKMAFSVISVEDSNTTYLDTYGWVLYKRGKIRKAERIFELIFELEDVNDSELFEHYGYILKKRRKCDEAVIQWQKAFERDTAKTYLIKDIAGCEK